MTIGLEDQGGGNGGAGPRFDPDSLRERYRRERDRRLREDGNDQYIEVRGQFAHFLDDPYGEPGFTRAPIDDAVRIDDQTCVDMVYRMLREEGLFLGGSSGINVGAAVALAREMGPGHTIVTLLCDRGDLYMDRLFNEAWLAGKGLQPIPFRRVGPGV